VEPPQSEYFSVMTMPFRLVTVSAGRPPSRDAIGGLLTGIPAPIRKNAFKAFARLCTAAVEYPVELIENAAAEKRAESRARVNLIDISAKQIAEKMQTDPEFARAAANKFAQKIIRERVNVDQIAEIAAAELKSEPQPVANEPDAPPISEDWLNTFESEASQMSSEQMQRLFGKILAGGVRRPGAFSIRTIRLMAQLDNHAAALFQLLCSLSVSIRVKGSNHVIDARVLSGGGGVSLQPYGLGFGELTILQEYGLIASPFETPDKDYRMAVGHVGEVAVQLIHQNLPWALVPKVPSAESQVIRVPGVALSGAGRELLPIVDTTPNEQFTKDLRNYFEVQGIVMTQTL
jgi:hypothetical protein